MRKIKIASAKNPLTDYIELNDFNGFLCTQFQTLGISRSVEFLTIKNRNIPVSNKPVFKKYSLVIEILTRYSQYETKYYELLNFLDRNKQDGIRLYHNPYGDNNEDNNRYCLCSIESSSKTEKRQPIVLNLTQNSLWLGKVNIEQTSQQGETTQRNLFEFADDGSGYYSVSFGADEKVPDYYSVAFYGGLSQKAEIEIKGYNEVPLTIIVQGECVNPEISVFRKDEGLPIKMFQVYEKINAGHYLEINSGILENGVWEVNTETGYRRDLTELVNYAHGSPYFYLSNGMYDVEVKDSGGNQCVTTVYWQEEYSE